MASCVSQRHAKTLRGPALLSSVRQPSPPSLPLRGTHWRSPAVVQLPVSPERSLGSPRPAAWLREWQRAEVPGNGEGDRHIGQRREVPAIHQRVRQGKARAVPWWTNQHRSEEGPGHCARKHKTDRVWLAGSIGLGALGPILGTGGKEVGPPRRRARSLVLPDEQQSRCDRGELTCREDVASR